MPHDRLKDYAPQPKKREQRKMLTCSLQTFEDLRQIADDLKMPMSKTIGALVDLYLDEEELE